MKIELVKIAGRTAGYSLVPENRAEKTALNTIGELYLRRGNDDENPVRCEGIETQVGGNTVARLNFMQGKYQPYDIKSLSKIGEVDVIEVQEDSGWQSHCFKCSGCGSQNVQMRAWVNPNKNNEFIDYMTGCHEADDCWCEDCEQHLKLKQVKVKPSGAKQKK